MAGNFQAPPRKKIALDNSKLNLTAPCPTAPGKISALSWGFVKNNPRLTVYTRDPAEDNEKTGYGKIVANLDLPTLYMFFDNVHRAIVAENGFKVKIENKNYTFFGGKRSDAPQVLTELWTGKDKDGCVWVSITAVGRPMIKFIFGGTEFHHLFHGDGSPYTQAEASVGFAKGHIDLMRQLYSQVAVAEYVEPEPYQPRQGQGGGGNFGNRGGGNYGGGGGNGGGYNKPAQPSIPSEDLPF